MTASTFPAVLAAQLRSDPGRPLVTFYDDATGERVELSVTTYANWVAKTAGLLQDELDAERGGLLLVDLPTHWLGPVWLGAAWSVGVAVTDDAGLLAEADLVVCGPDGVARYAEATARPVVAVSLRPLGAPFAQALPTGVVDYAAVVLGQPDAFGAVDPPVADDVAWRGARPRRQGELAGTATEPVRLLTDTNPCTEAGLDTLLEPLASGGGTVWVSRPDPDGWERRAHAERATRTQRA